MNETSEVDEWHYVQEQYTRRDCCCRWVKKMDNDISRLNSVRGVWRN